MQSNAGLRGRATHRGTVEGSVQFASQAMAFNFASRATAMVLSPMTGTSKRISCPGLVTLTRIASRSRRLPPRRMHSLVPSKASTARTVPDLTTTDCPISSRLISLAMPKPNWTSSTCRGLSRGPAIWPWRMASSVEEGHCVQHFEASLGELICDLTEQSLGVAAP